jgi:hypothetical protein
MCRETADHPRVPQVEPGETLVQAAHHVGGTLMLFLPEASGPGRPVPATVERSPGSVRRTSSIDTARPDGLLGDLVVTGRARDLRTGRDGSPGVLGEAELSARIDGTTRQLVSITTSPPVPELDRLTGCSVGPGFRSRVTACCPGERDDSTLLYLLLDDLPGATLVSGYAVQRAGVLSRPRQPRGAGGDSPAPMMMAQDDLCAGWAHDATMMVTIRSTGEIPVPAGPPAPRLERRDDSMAWHPMEPLAPHAMRRRRRLDVVAPGVSGQSYLLDAHFRDSHMSDAGAESVVHEYSLTGAIDGTGTRVVDISAEAHVLPWMECPGALASAGRIVGMRTGELRARVRRELTGASTCTHLNDTLRSLGDVEVLVAELSGHSGPGCGFR